MKLTKRLRKKINRKLKSNWTQENLLTAAFKAQIEAQISSRVRKAKTMEEVDMIISEFTIKPLRQSIFNLSNSTFTKSGKEFDLIVGAFIKNPKNKYLNLRSKNMLNRKEDYDRFLEAFQHNVSLIKDLPQDIALDMEKAYKRGTAFRGTEFAKELTERLGKRARVIIRTESAKISSTLTQLRMQKLGLNAYIWSTSEDSRVRSSHSILDGVLFFWNDPPTIDNYQNHCGRFINCRCVPIPVASLDDIQFPIKVAHSLNIQSEWVKGGKGKYDTKIVSGAIITYTREQFIAEFGKQFS